MPFSHVSIAAASNEINILENKKVLLRERKRHTARRVAIASPCYSGRGEGGPLTKFFPPSLNMYQAKSGVKIFSLYWDQVPPLTWTWDPPPPPKVWTDWKYNLPSSFGWRAVKFHWNSEVKPLPVKCHYNLDEYRLRFWTAAVVIIVINKQWKCIAFGYVLKLFNLTENAQSLQVLNIHLFEVSFPLQTSEYVHVFVFVHNLSLK